MSKYEPLKSFLANAEKSEIRLTLEEIEGILGFELPKSAKLYNAWWSNHQGTHVQSNAWLSAGYETEQVDLSVGKLVFVRNDASKAKESRTQKTKDAGDTGRHPAFGIWKGKVTLLPDYDYTQPADPDWGKVYGD